MYFAFATLSCVDFLVVIVHIHLPAGRFSSFHSVWISFILQASPVQPRQRWSQRRRSQAQGITSKTTCLTWTRLLFLLILFRAIEKTHSSHGTYKTT